MDSEEHKTYYIKSWRKFDDIRSYGMMEIAHRFPNLPNPNENIFKRFVKKNTNRYFRKHLGFTYHYDWDRNDVYGSLVVNDPKKFMLFLLKYGLSL